MTSKKFISNTSLHLLVLVLLCIGIYGKTLGVPFHFDDFPNIEKNSIIKDLNYFIDPGKARLLPEYKAFGSRPIGYLSFALNYRLHGLDPVGYHVVNISIHALNAIFLYALVMLSFRTPTLRSSSLAQDKQWAALLAAALFVVHPVQTQAITYIVQRFSSLAALFYLGAMVGYIISRTASSRKIRWGFYALALVFCLMGMKTKQTVFTLPVALVLYETVFFKGSWKGRTSYLLPFIFSMAVVPLSAMAYDSGATGAATVLDLPRDEYFFTQLRVITTYLRLLMLPVGQNLDYNYPWYDSLFYLPAGASLLVLLAVQGIAVFMFNRSRHGEPAWALAAFGIFFFFLALSVESTFIPLRTIFEHRLYLPSSGIMVLIGVSGVYFAQRLPVRWRREFVLLSMSICMVLAVLAYQRNSIWQNGISLWTDTVKKAPGNGRAWINLGSEYYKIEEWDMAFQYFRNALPQYATFEAEYRSLSRTEHLKRVRTSSVYSRQANEYAKIYYNLGYLESAKGEYNKAIEHYGVAVEILPNFTSALYFLGQSYYMIGETVKARTALRDALIYDPQNPAIRELLWTVERTVKN